MKLIDKAILGMVSESPGRNESEPIVGYRQGMFYRVTAPALDPTNRRGPEMSG